VLNSDLKAYKSGVDYYTNFGQNLYTETLLNANKSFKSGEIDYLQYITLLDHANTIKINYLQNNFFYNLTVIEANNILN
jgi:cobalt-zinc-cadmium resistance protein CzcA